MAASPKTATSISPRLKCLLSVVLVMHLAAVAIPPFTFATRSGYETSPLANLGMTIVQPYANALFLNHGYFFFAPSPGPSHLVEYDVEFKKHMMLSSRNMGKKRRSKKGKHKQTSKLSATSVQRMIPVMVVI